MAVTVNIRYKGEGNNALLFAKEMTESGTVKKIREEEGNLRYEYFLPFDGGKEILLIDSWTDQEAIDRHHHTPMMKDIIELRVKYDLHMTVERYVSEEGDPSDDKYIKK